MMIAALNFLGLNTLENVFFVQTKCQITSEISSSNSECFELYFDMKPLYLSEGCNLDPSYTFDGQMWCRIRDLTLEINISK